MWAPAVSRFAINLLYVSERDLTGTGVAYINLTMPNTDRSNVRTMDQWPGKMSKPESKVPTIMTYDSANLDQGPVSWGFQSMTESEQGDSRLLAEWFKCGFKNRSKDPELPDVDTLYGDYLSNLYSHIRNRLPHPGFFGNNVTWDTAAVEFIFSVPVTWESDDDKRFLDIARKAGFGSGTHRIGTCLTEPQAVAVYAAYEEQGLLKVCSPYTKPLEQYARQHQRLTGIPGWR